MCISCSRGRLLASLTGLFQRAAHIPIHTQSSPTWSCSSPLPQQPVAGQGVLEESTSRQVGTKNKSSCLTLAVCSRVMYVDVSSFMLLWGCRGMLCNSTLHQVNKISLDVRHISEECINQKLMRSFHQATTISNWILNCLHCPNPNYTDRNCAGQPFQFHRWSVHVLESVGAKEKQHSDIALLKSITKTQALW